MAASFVDRPEINSSWCSSHLFITIKLETFISLIYIELFAMCIPAQLQLMCALQANVFSFFFFCGRQAIHLLCIWRTSMRWSASTFGFVYKMKKAVLSVSRMCLCTSWEGSECKGTLSGESPPQCMLGGRGVMTEKNLKLLQGRPTDTAHWHQQRRPVTSNACHTATQGQSTWLWRHWCGTQ